MPHFAFKLLPCLLFTACNAGFTDFRASSDAVDAGPGVSRVIDAGFADGAAVEIEARRVSSGTWEGRGSYSAAGTAEIAITEKGTVELRLSDDFSVSGVPGPFVVLSSRNSLGQRIEPEQGDLEVGGLSGNRGPQVFEIPPEAADLPYVWIFCKPFGVEVGRAKLESEL